MKLNFACGKQTWLDFFCVDATQHPKATRKLDMVHAFEFDRDVLRNPLPLDDGSFEEVHAYHFIEHVRRYEADAVIAEFYRLLTPGGKLVLELPDLEKACRNLLKGMGDQHTMWPIYGDWNHKDPYMLHKHGYTAKTITQLLESQGFKNIEILHPQTHGARVNRDMRVEANK